MKCECCGGELVELDRAGSRVRCWCRKCGLECVIDTGATPAEIEEAEATVDCEPLD